MWTEHPITNTIPRPAGMQPSHGKRTRHNDLELPPHWGWLPAKTTVHGKTVFRVVNLRSGRIRENCNAVDLHYSAWRGILRDRKIERAETARAKWTAKWDGREITLVDGRKARISQQWGEGRWIVFTEDGESGSVRLQDICKADGMALIGITA